MCDLAEYTYKHIHLYIRKFMLNVRYNITSWNVMCNIM